jgi:hypothetical protein
MTSRSWIDDEPPASASVRQAAKLFVAGLRRPVALIVSAAALIALCAGAVALSKIWYAPTYILRVVEAERDLGATPRPRRQLADYVRQAVFTSAPLLDVIRRHGLYPSLARKNPRAALDSFREDIDVEVYQNYFLEERSVGSVPRSARLRVSYHNSNPEVAVSVTRDLGGLIVEHEMSVRRDLASRAAERAKDEVDAARHALAARRSEVAVTRSELDRTSVVEPQRQVEFVGLLGSLPALELRQDASERREASLALGAALERRGVGMSFAVVDDASLSSEAGARTAQIALALASLAFGLPLVTMAVGAFAPRKGRA